MKSTEEVRTQLRDAFDPTNPYGFAVHTVLDDLAEVARDLEAARDRLQNLELELAECRRQNGGDA